MSITWTVLLILAVIAVIFLVGAGNRGTFVRRGGTTRVVEREVEPKRADTERVVERVVEPERPTTERVVERDAEDPGVL